MLSSSKFKRFFISSNQFGLFYEILRFVKDVVSLKILSKKFPQVGGCETIIEKPTRKWFVVLCAKTVFEKVLKLPVEGRFKLLK